MNYHVPDLRARVLARAHPDPNEEKHGWSQTSLFFFPQNQNSTHKLTTSLAGALDCTASMSELLARKAQKKLVEYVPSTPIPIAIGNPPIALSTAVVLKNGKAYWAEVDGEHFDVTVDVKRLLKQRLDFIRRGISERPTLGSRIPNFGVSFSIPPVGDDSVLHVINHGLPSFSPTAVEASRSVSDAGAFLSR